MSLFKHSSQLLSCDKISNFEILQNFDDTQNLYIPFVSIFVCTNTPTNLQHTHAESITCIIDASLLEWWNSCQQIYIPLLLRLQVTGIKATRRKFYLN